MLVPWNHTTIEAFSLEYNKERYDIMIEEWYILVYKSLGAFHRAIYSVRVCISYLDP